MRTLSQGRTHRAVLPIVCAGVALASLDLFVVNVALADIGADFGVDGLAKLSWVINGYAIAYAALLVLFGRLAERHARERAFLLGVGAFVLASALCAAATSVEVLVGARVLQAAGAALLTPTSLGLVLATTADAERAAAVRAWTAVGGVAAAIGPVVGGLLVQLSWRWVFLVNVPIGVAAIVAGARLLPHVPGHPAPRPDAVGAALVTASVGLASYGLVEADAWGWTSGRTAAVLVLATVAGVAFVRRCLRVPHPLVDAALLRRGSFRSATFVAVAFSAAFGAMLLSIILWHQEVWGWSALRTGLGVAPGPLMVPLLSFLAVGPLVARFGAPAVTAAGSFTFAAGCAWWVGAAGLDGGYAGAVLPGMVLTGVGVGLALPTLMGWATATLPPASAATGSAVVNMGRQIGLALGVALLVAVVGSPASPDEALDAFRWGWVLAAGLGIGSGVLALRKEQTWKRP